MAHKDKEAKEFDNVMNRVNAKNLNYSKSEYWSDKRSLINSDNYNDENEIKEMTPLLLEVSQSFKDDDERKTTLYSPENRYLTTILVNELRDIDNASGDVTKAIKAILSGETKNYRQFLEKGYGKIWGSNDEYNAKALFTIIDESKKLLSKTRYFTGNRKDLRPIERKNGVVSTGIYTLPREFYSDLYDKMETIQAKEELTPNMSKIVEREILNRYHINKPNEPIFKSTTDMFLDLL